MDGRKTSGRLGRAYRAVAYGADAAWSADPPSALHRASMELRRREELVASRTSANRLLPRTVRDAIPGSRLAAYGDYRYAGSRELCYAPAAAARRPAPAAAFDGCAPPEPWMLREVDELYRRLVDYKEEFRNGAPQYDVFRSPFFEATTSEEIVLKLKTVGVKRYWETDRSYHERNPLVTRDKVLLVYRSSTGNVLISQDSPSEKYKSDEEFFRGIPEIDRYFAHLKELSQSFKEQTFWVSAYQQRLARSPAAAGPPWLGPAPDYDLDHPHRRLYSAVLQGARAAAAAAAASASPRPAAAAGAAPDGRMVLLSKGGYGARAAPHQAAPNGGTALLAQAQAAAYRAQWAWLGGAASEDHAHRPVAASRSEELELQALRQYTPSETELEREAAEQYEGPPENWLRPPNHREPSFGGRAWPRPPLIAIAAAAALC